MTKRSAITQIRIRSMAAAPNESAASRPRWSGVGHRLSRWLSRTLLTLGVIGLTLALGGWAAHLRFNVNGSLPIGLYRVVAPSLTRGSLVLACLPRSVARLARERGYVHRGSCPGGDAPIGKRVLAVAGDTVEVSGRGIIVDGRLALGSEPLTHDSQGRTLTRAIPARSIVRVGTVWLFSNHSLRSFDSRYFGAVAVSAVVGGLRVVAARR